MKVITKPLRLAHKKDVGRTAFHAASYGRRYGAGGFGI